MLGECRAGQRRYTGSDIGEQYAHKLAFEGEGDATPPKPHERPLGDILLPSRPGTATDLVNQASQVAGTDAKAWRFDRVIRMVGSMAAVSPPDV